MKEKGFNLDHFYTSFPKDYFDSLKQLTKICKGVQHKQTNKVFDSSIDGIYILTKDGHYIELINRKTSLGNEKPNFIALNTFLSPLKDESTLHSLVREKLPWKRTPQPSKIPDNGSYQTEDIGKEWFHVWYVENKIAHDENTSIWIIDYQNKKFNRTLNNKSLKMEFDFKQVLDVKWSLNSKGFEVMKTEGRWSSKEYKNMGDSLLLTLNNPNGKDVNFEFIKNDERKQGFEAIALEKMDKNIEFELQDNSFIELMDEKNKSTLFFNEY